MLTFWETKRGVMLADSLIRCLPKLTEKEQRYRTVKNAEELTANIKEIIDKGGEYVTHIADKDGFMIIYRV